MKKTVSDFLFDWHIVFLYIGFVFGSGWRFYSIEHDAVLQKNHKKFESDERFNIILGEKFKLLIYYLIFGRSTILGIPIALLIFHYLPSNFFNWIYSSYLNDFGPMVFFFFCSHCIFNIWSIYCSLLRVNNVCFRRDRIQI